VLPSCVGSPEPHNRNIRNEAPLGSRPRIGGLAGRRMAMKTKARMIELQARAVDGGPEPVLDDVEIGRVLGLSRTTCRRIGVATLTKCRHW
jgi:hypothetical protein